LPPVWKRERIKHRIRFTRRERANRIYRRIHDSTIRNKPLTIPQIARLERISKSTVYRYLPYIRRSQRKRGILINIRRVKKKRFLIYEKIAVKGPALTVPRWELIGVVKYDQQGPARILELKVMILLPNRDKATIDKGIEEIKDMMQDHNFAGLVPSMEFTTIPATAESRPYFRYLHSGGSQYTDIW